MGAPDWAAVHAEFPINENLIWLNNCGISAMPGPVLDRQVAHLRAYAARGVLGVPSEVAMHDAVRAKLAPWLGCDPDELCLVHNTNEGITFLSHGVDLATGDHILLLENEYPSNVYPWQHWQARGVEIGFAPLARSPGEFLERFTAALRPRTRVVSLSAVHWCTGMPLPIAAIGQLCAARGIDLFLDGAQAVGHVPLDLRTGAITAMAFSAWKWLLGPIGVGVLYVRGDALPRLRLPWKGTASVTDDETYLPYRDTIKPKTDRYVLSTPNYNDWAHFDASLDYLGQFGPEVVRARLHALADYLARGLRGLGFELARDGFPGLPTAIIAASKPGHDRAALVAGLQARGIVAVARLGRLRLAPHIYLLERQLDQVIAALAALTA